MTKTFPVEVGQTVYLGVLDGYAPKLPAKKMIVGTITKIGSLYLYVRCNPYTKPLRFSKYNMKFSPSPHNLHDNNYIIFETKEDFLTEMERREYRKTIASCLSSSLSANLDTLDISLEALKKIYAVLKEEGVNKLNPVEEIDYTRDKTGSEYWSAEEKE